MAKSGKTTEGASSASGKSTAAAEVLPSEGKEKSNKALMAILILAAAIAVLYVLGKKQEQAEQPLRATSNGLDHEEGAIRPMELG